MLSVSAHPFPPGAPADPSLVAAIRNLTITLASQHRVISPVVNASHLAHTTLQTLQYIPDGISSVVGAGEPVLTDALQSELLTVSAREKEAGVVKFLTPHLSNLRLPAVGLLDPCPPVLVNSENLQWLVHPSVKARRDLRLKPDLFRSWAPFVEVRGGSRKQGSGPVYVFGVLADYALQTAGCASELYEAKVKLTESDFGELCAYHECVTGVCIGMLFDATDFWLYQSNAGNPVRLLKGRWTAPGSADSIRDFFTVPDPPLVKLLRRLLVDLRVTPVQLDGRSHLGSGGYGHVFAVGDLAAPQALKVVHTSDLTHIAREFWCLADAAEAGAPVVPPVKDSLRYYGDDEDACGGGYLLSRVGTEFKVSNQAQCCAAFEALAALHVRGIIHGDPRLPNLLLVGARACWVDLFSSASRVPVPDMQRGDAAILVRSVLLLGLKDALPAGVDTVLRRYNAAAAESVTALSVVVWVSRGGKT